MGGRTQERRSIKHIQYKIGPYPTHAGHTFLLMIVENIYIEREPHDVEKIEIEIAEKKSDK